MSDEITFNWTLTCENGTLKVTRSPDRQTIDQSATGRSVQSQTITATGAEVLNFAADLASKGIAMVANLDDGNYIEIGIFATATSTFYPFMKLKASESFAFRFATACVPYALANTAACKLDHETRED